MQAINVLGFFGALDIEALFLTDYWRGIVLLLCIFPFLVKAAVVYFKIERREKGEKLKSEKYYQLLVYEYAVFIAFLMVVWWVALILSLIISAIAFCANRTIVKKNCSPEEDKDCSAYFIKCRELLITFLLTVIESAAVSLIFENIQVELL